MTAPQWELGPFILTPFSLSFSVAVIAAVILAYAEARRRLLSQQRVIDFMLLALLSGVVAGRLAYAFLFHRDHFLENPAELIYFHEGGLSFWGGFLAATMAVSIWAFGKKFVLERYLDIAAPALAVALVLGWVGFPPGGKPMAVPRPWGIQAGAELIHPDGVYTIVLLIILVALVWRRRLAARYDGELFMWFTAGYAVVNLVADSFRAGAPYQWGLSPGQLCASAALVLVLFYIFFAPKSYISPYRAGGRTIQPPSRGRRFLANLFLLAVMAALSALYYYLHGLPLFLT